jgi:uncharacterized protein (TIGR02271 family)
VVTPNSNIDWNDVIKKEARGSGDEDLGEVQEVGPNYVLVKRGLVNKEKFYIPKDQVESYDGDTLRFRISEEEVKSKYMGEYPPSSLTSKTQNTATDRTKVEETTVPVTEERLGVSKSQSTREATITKTPVTETKTVEVPVTHEEISVERRPVSGTTTTTSASNRPVESEQEIRVPLKQEQVQVTKQPYVKEEVAVKKKPVTETKTVSDQVTSEEVRVKGTNIEEEE